jgi:transcriptional regulator GlxA family with amidase domain
VKMLIYLFDGMTALDAIGPYESLTRLPDTRIVFVGNAKGPVKTGDGFLTFQIDADIDSETTADLLIVPGGGKTGLLKTIADERVLSWIRRVDRSTEWTCSVSTGSLILGAAGLLKGRRASTHWRAKDALAGFGCDYLDARVTTDGKYMTSAGVSAGIDMGLRLCAEISGNDIARAVQLSMQYDPQPPFDTGSLERATDECVRFVEGYLRT